MRFVKSRIGIKHVALTLTVAIGLSGCVSGRYVDHMGGLDRNIRKYYLAHGQFPANRKELAQFEQERQLPRDSSFFTWLRFKTDNDGRLAVSMKKGVWIFSEGDGGLFVSPETLRRTPVDAPRTSPNKSSN